MKAHPKLLRKLHATQILNRNSWKAYLEPPHETQPPQVKCSYSISALTKESIKVHHQQGLQQETRPKEV